MTATSTRIPGVRAAVARSSGRRAVEVGEQQAAGPGTHRDRDRLLGRRMATPRFVVRRRRERGLLDEQVGAGRDLDQSVGRAAVAMTTTKKK